MSDMNCCCNTTTTTLSNAVYSVVWSPSFIYSLFIAILSCWIVALNGNALECVSPGRGGG